MARVCVRAQDGDKDRFAMAAMILEMDFAVGKVVEATQNASMYNNTIFILSADNGGISKGGGYNYPLRGEKATFWECVHPLFLPNTHA